MSFRTVVITQRSKLDSRMGYLMIRSDTETQRVFLEEINTLIIENPACCISGCLLAELTRMKIKVIFCDEKHNPVSELIPCYGHVSSAGKLREQIGWNCDFLKVLWTNIVREKIKNQALFLQELSYIREAELLGNYVLQLQIGDPANREGHAAKVYFNAVFGKTFKRGCGNAVDAALNYGYSLILSAFNREIVAAGFSTQLGIAHHNVFNHFNLSCDLMEPFRILIDRHVFSYNFTQFESREKHQVLEIFEHPFLMKGENRRLDDCIRLYIGSIFRAIEKEDLLELKFCSWR